MRCVIGSDLLVLQQPHATKWNLGKGIEQGIRVASVPKVYDAARGIVFEDLGGHIIITENKGSLEFWIYQ